jgi:DNA-directed RNA polymerase sigma subunit (sigma70/sigma32)
MSVDGRTWDLRRIEQLRASLTDAELVALKSKGQSNPASLSLDEVGVLFLVTRERIREIERLESSKGGGI